MTNTINKVIHNGTEYLIKDTTYSNLPASSGGTDVSLVTTGDKYTWDAKQDALVSGTNIKTVNSTSLLGSGNLDINAVPSGGSTGQVLTKNSSGYGWANATASSTTTATLTTAGWSNKEQTVTGVTGVTASNTVIVSPAPASINDYALNSVYCESQGSGTLTFKCNSVPDDAITVNVLILS